MPVPTPDEYIPYDENAPATFITARTGAYIYLAFMMLILYDHLITLDLEIERLWTLKWRLPKVLFLINRYIVSPLILLTTFGKTLYPLLESFCGVLVYLDLWKTVLALAVAELILIIRVSALYGHGKAMRRFLIGLFACEMIAVIANTILIQKNYTPIIAYQHLEGCYAVAGDNYYTFWIPFLIFDGIVTFLTMYKVFAYRKDMNPTVTLLARDSLVYFVLITASLLLDVIISKVPVGLTFTVPPQSISCIAVSRMMMNLRGLIFDDPNGTANLKLPTIEFHNPTPVFTIDLTEDAYDDMLGC